MSNLPDNWQNVRNHVNSTSPYRDFPVIEERTIDANSQTVETAQPSQQVEVVLRERLRFSPRNIFLEIFFCTVVMAFSQKTITLIFPKLTTYINLVVSLFMVFGLLWLAIEINKALLKAWRTSDRVTTSNSILVEWEISLCELQIPIIRLMQLGQILASIALSQALVKFF